MKLKPIYKIPALVLALIGSFLIMKLSFLNHYNLSVKEYNETIKGLHFKDEIKIETKSLNENEYLTFKDIKIRNDFKNFTLQETQENSNFAKYILKDSEDKLQASIWLGESFSYVDVLKSDKTLYGTNEKRITNKSLTNFFKKHNINNDIDLFKFLEENKDVKNKFTMSKKEMKENFTIRFLASVIIPRVENITKLTGDLNGYILNVSEDIKEVSILKNDKRYVITFLIKDYFSEDYIKELLNTVVIEDKSIEENK